ncbi:VIT domain-containing protein [Thermomonas sp.]|uniref:VIT domain-containing protein n=1 Tax=Thermomonas sp. TaxID=1971895 RepID=UPI002621D194|nr:VIT domain-containing protein [Thermomonas sp.]MCO5054144.1 DUF2135 domain-containing protein [Thermomonas sp.]HRO62568.1 VIT domain-containing protein [Thermomonas sp.]
MKPLPACTTLAFALAAAIASSSALAESPQIRVEGEVQTRATALEWTLDGPFALRRIELVVRNPHNRPLEAVVRLPLAANERLRGYALDVDGQLRDAVPVERVQARVAFEEIERRGIDPALAEKDVGNSYRIRVFPVPAHGERRVRIEVASLGERRVCGWEHVLDAGLPAGSALQASASVRGPLAHGGDAGLAWAASGERLSAHWNSDRTGTARNLCVQAPVGNAGFSARFDDGLRMHWLEVPVPPQPARASTPFPARIEIVWDASYSTLGKDRRAELELLANYLRGHTVEIQLNVLRETLQRSQVRIATQADVDALIARLARETPDGATALADWHASGRAERVLLFSDAVNTLPGLMQPDAAMPVFVIARGIGDPALARWLTRSGGQVLDLATLAPADALRALTHAPALEARLGALDGDWHMDSIAANNGALRGCHVSSDATSVPRLPVAHATATGVAVRRHVSTELRASELAAFWCAVWQAEDLEAQPQRNAAQLAALGQRFGVPNRETSLLVLERDEDYVRYGILPPQADAALYARVLARRAEQENEKARDWAANRSAIAQGWQARIDWWNTRFPKNAPPRQPKVAGGNGGRDASLDSADVMMARPTPAPMYAPMAESAPPPAARASSVALLAPGTVAATASDAGTSPAISMQLKAVAMDAPYVAELSTAQSATALYQRYLDLRTQYGQSPAFHFDVAQRLFELGDAALGWRVLSNIVELMPTQQAALRLVAYRLREAGMAKEAIALLRQIRALAPDEPQSFRDLALALAQPATCREALDLFQHVVDSPWDSRFADIGLIALAERNDLHSRCPTIPLRDAGEATAQALPVGLRVTLRWDLNDTDIDLHVTDPNGEEVYYAHRNSYQGGALSRDFTGGYGPEEFILRDPKPGDYTVSVVYFGSRLAQLARGATINVALQTGFGTPALRQQAINMRLLERTGNVRVGRFRVAGNGQLQVAPADPAADK